MIKPMFNQVLTTAEQYKDDELNGTLIDINKTKGTVKEYQKVIAVGPSVKNVQVGDLVMINPIRYSERKHQEGSMKDGVVTDNPVTRYNLPVIVLEDVPYLLLFDNDISFIVSDYEEVEEKVGEKGPSIIVPDPVLVTNC